jgi:PAS domain-containing protein
MHISDTDLKTIFSAMTDLILVYDDRGRCLQVAPTRHNILGESVLEQLASTYF